MAYQVRRGADKHEKKAQGQRPGKDHSQAGIGKHARAGHWQTFPGRDLAKCPRQGIGQVSQAGTAKRARAGHWQTFPGRELVSVPRQGTGKRSQAGNWQASQAGTASMPSQGMHTGKRSQAGTANVPSQGTGKCSQAVTVDIPTHGTVVVPRQGTVGIAKEHGSKKFSNGMPPTPEVPLHCQPAACCVTSLHACVRDDHEGYC